MTIAHSHRDSEKKTGSKTVDNCLLSRRRHVNVPTGTTPRRERENEAKREMAVGDHQMT